MPPNDKAVIAELLGVVEPWRVVDVQVDPGNRLVTVKVEHAEPPARFWSRREPPPIRHRLRWDHVSMAGLRCQILLGLREGQRPPAVPWTGEGDLSFSRGLSRQVLDLLIAGATLDQLCLLLQLPFAELWRYKFRLDQGGVRFPEPRAASSEASVPRSSVAAAGLGGPAVIGGNTVGGNTTALPSERSQVWMALLLGRQQLDVRTLSLKLLLTKLQGEARQHQDADLHRHAAQGLHRYFAKNHSLLAYEISQLDAAQRQAAQQPLTKGDGILATRALPDASDPLWLDLLHGDRQLDVRTLSLKLLLTKLRSQISIISDDDVRMLKLVELHRFFERNHALLRHEISQIHRWTVH